MPTLEFKGKQFVYSHHHTVPFRELVVDEKKSLPKDGKANLDDNLIIHGDNLHALKALMPRYAGKVKCVYIDPPYNTGNESWVYNDNVNSPLMKQWLKDMKPVDKEDMERHDKWLCMMYPRLKLLHELLADDGVMFVSIDDNEQHHLRMLMDEVFGEENFIITVVWQKRYTRSNNTNNFTTTVEYLHVYRKSELFQVNLLQRNEEANARFTNPDNDPRGPWKATPFLNQVSPDKRPNLSYPITNPHTGKITLPTKKAWRCEETVFLRMQEENRLYWGTKKDRAVPDIKTFLSEVRQGMTPINFWSFEFAGNTDQANNEIKEIFQDKVFDTIKPTQLIKRVLEHATDKNSIVLDSFAGSGTTANAVLDLNKEDGGNRKFILVECEEYADSITAERVRRVIKGVPTAKNEKLKNGLGGSFTFCELGQAMEIEKMLTGESLPAYENLASYVFYTATGKSLEKPAKSRPDFFVGETDLYEIYLIYKPDLAFLRGNESALNFDKVEIIKSRNASKKTKLVFATAKFMGQKELVESGVSFCQLPYAIHKIAGK